jgi:hypothetical protein
MDRMKEMGGSVAIRDLIYNPGICLDGMKNHEKP